MAATPNPNPNPKTERKAQRARNEKHRGLASTGAEMDHTLAPHRVAAATHGAACHACTSAPHKPSAHALTQPCITPALTRDRMGLEDKRLTIIPSVMVDASKTSGPDRYGQADGAPR